MQLLCSYAAVKILCAALTIMAQRVGHHPANREVASSIPGQGAYLGCRPGPWLGVFERQPMGVSLTH